MRQKRPRAAESDAGPVERGLRPALAVADQRHCQGDAQRADGQVEPEDGLPSPALDEDAAEHRSERRGGGAERPEQARCEPLPSDRERVEQKHQRGGHDGRRADSLHDAERDELVDGLGPRAAERGDGEQCEAEDEEALVAVAVGEPAHREEQHGEREVVAVHHPRDRDDRGLEAADDQRHGDAHDRGIGQGEDDPGEQGGDDEPRTCRGHIRGRAAEREALVGAHGRSVQCEG